MKKYVVNVMMLLFVTVSCTAKIEIKEPGVHGFVDRVGNYLKNTALYQYFAGSKNVDPIILSSVELKLISPNGEMVSMPWSAMTLPTYKLPDPVTDKSNVKALKKRLKKIRKQRYIPLEDALTAPEAQDALARVLGLTDAEKRKVQEDVKAERL